MPSPLAHLAAGYALGEFLRARDPVFRADALPVRLAALAGAMAFSMAPDMDAVIGILAGNLGHYHNRATHSLLLAPVLALLAAAAARAWRPARVAFWFKAALAGVTLHVLMDYATIGRGVMLAWPLSTHRFLSPVSLFLGLQWAQGVFSLQHLWTALSEAPFVLLFALLPRVTAARQPPGGSGA